MQALYIHIRCIYNTSYMNGGMERTVGFNTEREGRVIVIEE
jgi:hypothetical protein